MSKASRFIRAVSAFRRPSSWGPFVETYESTKFDHAFSTSWAQGGEDIALLSLFQGKSNGSYVDVGAHHPSRFSTTRMLYQRGWRGVNVEANPDLMEAFYRSRPDEVNLNLAVGSRSEYIFQIFSEPALSTYVKDWAEKFVSEGAQPIREVVVPGRSLRSIFDEYFPITGPDLLCVDAEGSDFEVLLSLELPTLSDSRRPRVLMVEASPPVSVALEGKSVLHAIENEYVPHFVLPMSTVLLKR